MMKKIILLLATLIAFTSNAQTTILPGKSGGTGIANVNKTITLGGSVITTGTSTPTLAFPSNNRSFTFPDTSDRLAMFHYTLPRSGTLSGYPLTGPIRFAPSSVTTALGSTTSDFSIGAGDNIDLDGAASEYALASFGYSSNTVLLGGKNSGGTKTYFTVAPTGATFTYHPAKYAADYSSLFDARTLIDSAFAAAHYAPISYTTAPTSAIAPLLLSSNVMSLRYSTGLTVTSNSLAVNNVPNSALANSTFTIGGIAGTLGSSTSGTFTAGTWNATAIGPTYGGTGLTSVTTGDIIYGSASNTWSALADVSAGSYLRSGGVTTVPLWSTLKLPNSATANYIPYATSTNTWGESSSLTFDGTYLGINNSSAASRIDLSGLGSSASNDGIRVRQPNVAHGITTIVPTDCYGYFSWVNSTDGGVTIAGLSDADAIGVLISGVNGSSSPTKGAIEFRATKKNGTGVQSLASGEIHTEFRNGASTVIDQIISTGEIGIGASAAVGKPIFAQYTSNGAITAQVQNQSTGTAGISVFQLSNSTQSCSFSKYSTGFTTSGLLTANLNRLAGGAAGNMLFDIASSTDFIWSIGGTAASNEKFRVASTGLVSINAPTGATKGAWLHVAVTPSVAASSAYGVVVAGNTNNTVDCSMQIINTSTLTSAGAIQYVTSDAGTGIFGAFSSTHTAVPTATGKVGFYNINATGGMIVGTRNATGMDLIFNDAIKANFNSSGRLFIGTTTSATALLHLGAGTASASTAPLKFTSGTNLTAAEAGAVEYDGTSLFFTNSGAQRQSLMQAQTGRVSTQFDAAGTTTLAAITGLSTTVVSGKVYEFEANLFVDSDAGGGCKFSINGTATATNIIYEIIYTDNAAGTNSISARGTALNNSGGQVGSTAGYCKIKGLITVNAGGTLLPYFAQTVNSGTSSVLVGSNFIIRQIP